MLRVNAINRQELLKCLTFNPKSLVIKTVSVPVAHQPAHSLSKKDELTTRGCVKTHPLYRLLQLNFFL